jgi:hypothetical protein
MGHSSRRSKGDIHRYPGHPNRPATLPVQTLTMVEVFSRAGVDLRRSKEESVVPLSLADVDEGPTLN